MQRLRSLYSVGPSDLYRPHSRHPGVILPREKKPKGGRLSDFVCISSEAELVAHLDGCAATRRALRVIGSGWSWNRILQAEHGADNVVFTGEMSTSMAVDADAMRATVAGGVSICDFLFYCERERLDVEWPAKGFCFTLSESQTFAGFLATNVHHSHTPTAYEWVESVRLALFVDGRATIVRASREHHSDLFESVFGTVGITGVIVTVELRLRKPVKYDVHSERGRLRPHSLFGTATIAELLHRVAEPCTMIMINPAEGRFTVRVCPEAKDANAAPAVASTVLQQRGDDSKCLCCMPDLYDCMPWLLFFPCCACAPALRVCTAAFTNGANRKPGLAWDRSIVNWMEASLQADAVQEGTSLSLYQAHSWVWGRMYPVAKGRVAMTGETVHMDGSDVSLFVQLADWPKFVELAAPLIDEAPPFMIGVRYLPRGGGLIAANANSDAVCIEFGGVSGFCGLFSAHERWITSLLDAVYAVGIKLLFHPGKAFRPHPVFCDSLSAEQRCELVRLRETYDPLHVLDGGCVKFAQMYDLHPPCEGAAEGVGPEKVALGRSEASLLSGPKTML